MMSQMIIPRRQVADVDAFYGPGCVADLVGNGLATIQELTSQQEHVRKVAEWQLNLRARRNLLIMKKSWGCKNLVIPPLPVKPPLTAEQVEINKIADGLLREVLISGVDYDYYKLRARAEAMYREAHP
jgi:hypothetical protein